MIRTILTWIIILFVCLIAQSTVVHAVSIAGIMPDIVLVALFFLAIRSGVLPGVYAGFLLGLGQDLHTAETLGLNALANTVVGFLIGLFNDKVMRTDPLLKGALLIAAFVIHDLIFLIAQAVVTSHSLGSVAVELGIHTVPRALYSMLIVGAYFVWDLFLKPSFRR